MIGLLKFIIEFLLLYYYIVQLLSTDLPQHGGDKQGIKGFMLRDIRQLINEAAQRTCIYCNKRHATISCEVCKKYFHLMCGYINHCLYQFLGKFPSYCYSCRKFDPFYIKYLHELSGSYAKRCIICNGRLGPYTAMHCIYAPCCRKGFVHSICMLKYANSAGYALRCIWCRCVDFREFVKSQGIFVPDRDAAWEREKNAFRDLHHGHEVCNMPICNCPRGRKHITAVRWPLILCSSCGSVGAHNPSCIPGKENSKEKVDSFTCETCSSIEQKRLQESLSVANIPANRNESPAHNISLKEGNLEDPNLNSNEVAPIGSDNKLEEEVVEFDKGADPFRINLNEERFVGKSLEDTEESKDLIKVSEIINGSTDIPIINEIKEIINSYKKHSLYETCTNN